MVIRNFLFHRVSDEEDAMWPPMKPALFSRIISFLTRQYLVVPLEHFLNEPDFFKASGKSIATVLFDDGYKDNIEYAAPLLKKYNCPASFYIVTDCIDRNIPTWTYLVDHAFQTTQKNKLELPFHFVPERFKSVSLKNKNDNSNVIKAIKPWMKSLSNAERITITESVLSQCDDIKQLDNKMMSWDDIRQLHTEGFIIGSHSHTHPMLASLKDESEIKDELQLSAGRILSETGIIPQTISYPIGSFDERVTRLSKEQGYKYGLAVEQKFFSYPSGMMTIPRVELYQQPWWKVKMHMTGNYWNRIGRVVK